MLINPLPQGFGAEISDFNVANGNSPEDIARLQQSFMDDHLLVFRGSEPVSPERQVEMASWFGPVLVEGGAAWNVLDNAESYGSVRLPFHSDTSFMPEPLAGLALYMQEFPSGSTSTTFISNALGWDATPPELQREVRHLKSPHLYEADPATGWPDFEAWQPVVMAHPKTGRELLFVSENHCDRIEGMSKERAAEVLDVLFAALYAPERRYEHVWRQGDLVIFDNFAIQHARTRVADISAGRRVLRRVQLGETGFLSQLEEMLKKRGATAN
jgi:taurine dioxygenase